MFKKYSLRASNGITVIEVIVATFILLVAIVGSYSVFTQIFMATSSTSDRLVAAYLAQEGIEVIRNIRDTSWINSSDWGSMFTICNNGCQADYKTGIPGNFIGSLTPYNGDYLNIDANGFYTYENGTATKFKRKITVTPSGADRLDVLVEIIWANRGEPYSFQSEESLYNWR